MLGALCRKHGPTWQTVTEQLLEMCAGVTRETLSISSALTGEQFPAIEFPELHEDSVGELAMFGEVRGLMLASGVRDYGVRDWFAPPSRRLKRNLSAARKPARRRTPNPRSEESPRLLKKKRKKERKKEKSSQRDSRKGQKDRSLGLFRRRERGDKASARRRSLFLRDDFGGCVCLVFALEKCLSLLFAPIAFQRLIQVLNFAKYREEHLARYAELCAARDKRAAALETARRAHEDAKRLYRNPGSFVRYFAFWKNFGPSEYLEKWSFWMRRKGLNLVTVRRLAGLEQATCAEQAELAGVLARRPLGDFFFVFFGAIFT